MAQSHDYGTESRLQERHRFPEGFLARQEAIDAKIATLENRFGTVVAQLQDLRKQAKAEQQKLDRLLEKGK